MPQRARKKMQNNNVIARIKSGEVPEQKFEGEGVKNITASGAIADGIIKTFHEVAKGDQNEEVQMLCNASNVINMRIHEILGGKDNGGN